MAAAQKGAGMIRALQEKKEKTGRASWECQVSRPRSLMTWEASGTYCLFSKAASGFS